MTEQSIEPLTVGDAFEKNVSTFEGHPAEEISDESTEGSDGDKKPEEFEGDEKPKKKEDDKSSEDNKGKFKYASQEAAEDAYKEAEKLIGKSTAEAKLERERAEVLQVELNLVKTPVAPKEPEAPDTVQEDRFRELLDKVGAIDTEDPEYYAKTAKIWANHYNEIEATSEAKTDKKVAAALNAYDKKVQEDKARTDAEFNTQKSILSNATTAGTEAGLDMKKGSNDSEIFWAFADKAPEGSIEEQIQWTVDKVKGIKTTLAAPGKEKEEKDAEAARKAKENQEQNNVLERQGEGRQPDKKGPVAPLPLADGFKRIERRI